MMQSESKEVNDVEIMNHQSPMSVFHILKTLKFWLTKVNHTIERLQNMNNT